MSSDDNERTNLMSTEAEKQKKTPDWSKFGLTSDEQKWASPQKSDSTFGSYQHGGDEQQNDLFREEQNLSEHKPWWKANFFIMEPVLFGTWDGVFTSCLINLIGVIIFLRMGWIVGNAGIWMTIFIIFCAVFIVFIVAVSGIGVCERCKMGKGGVYFLLSHVMGGRIGGSLGIIYCFAQAVGCSLSVMGFGESILGLTGLDNPWIAKGVATGLVILLLGINVAGVKWVVRFQLILLIVMFLSVMDFLVGSFVHTEPESGFTGYESYNLHNNSGPHYVEGQSFFTIFGLFFSTVTGILAGINMSGDLHDPLSNIPNGTLAALGSSTLLYICFTVVLGATCLRPYLQADYMISQKVSVVGVLWLAGLYISSISNCMGSLYGPPRILQSIANENVIPLIRILGQGRGPNKVPIYALIVIILIVLLFVFVGDVNTLAPIVTTAFMITYAAVDYCYFALAMTYDRRQERDLRYGPPKRDSKGEITNGTVGYGTTGSSLDVRPKDSFEKVKTDLDKLFPERMTQRGQHHHIRESSYKTLSGDSTPDADFDATKRDKSLDAFSEHTDTSSLLVDKDGTGEPKKSLSDEITKLPSSWYSVLCNRWLSLFGVIVCIIIMFSINWIYAFVELSVAFIIYIYIGQASPGYFPGIAEFNMYDWIKEGFQRCCRGGKHPEEIIVAPTTPAVQTLASQLTEDNEDFASRGRYHQSEIVRGENFDEYDSS